MGYDRDLSILEVEFVHGGVYRYRQVPASVHRDFLAADSLGGYFTDSVRDRYPYERVE